jgi:hypothetical protein
MLRAKWPPASRGAEAQPAPAAADLPDRDWQHLRQRWSPRQLPSTRKRAISGPLPRAQLGKVAGKGKKSDKDSKVITVWF